MKINIGSINKSKTIGIKEALLTHNQFKDAQINSLKVSSEVSEQPMSLNETVLGAMNRCRNAFDNCDYSISYEGGLIEIKESKSGYLSIGVCAIFDGHNFYFGFAPSFEYPKVILDFILKEKVDISEAYKRLGLSNEVKLGEGDGAIGLLTNGKIVRKDLVKLATIMALIHIK